MIDKAPKTVTKRMEHQSRAVTVDRPQPNFEDDDAFDESVRFVSMLKRGDSVVADMSDEQVALEDIPVPKRVSTRPLPRKKKRKSDEVDGSSDVATDAPAVGTTDVNGGTIDFSTRLKAFKRFKQQNQLPAGADGAASENDADGTSSLTSLSNGPSSDAQGNGERQEASRGLRIKRSRGRRAMQVVYSSEPEENQMEVEVAPRRDSEKEPQALRPTLSSIVPDSQPGHRYSEDSLFECFGVPSSKAQQQQLAIPVATATELESRAVEQNPSPIRNTRTDNVLPARPTSIEVRTERDADMDTEPTQPLDNPELTATRNASRALRREESRTFPFPPEMLRELKAPVLRHNSSISMSSLRHSEPSQPDFMAPKYVPPLREAVTPVNSKGLPPLTDQDLESLPILQPAIRRPLIAMPAKLDEGDVFQIDPGDRQADGLDHPSEGPRIHASQDYKLAEVQHHDITGDAASAVPADLAQQGSANVQIPVPIASVALSGPVRLRASAPDNAERHIEEYPAASSAVGENDVEQDDVLDPYAEPDTETMLPLTLDTQLHRPGILSPDFQLRRRPPPAEPETETILPLSLDTQLAPDCVVRLATGPLCALS